MNHWTKVAAALVLVPCVIGWSENPQNASDRSTSYRPADLNTQDRTGWKILDKEQATKQAIKDAGFAEASLHMVELVSLQKIAIPYLAEQVATKPSWLIQWTNLALDLPSSPEGFRDAYTRTINLFIDPIRGSVIRVETQWPDSTPKMWDEVEPAEAAKQMRTSGNEKYLAFPDQPPGVSFLAAVDAVQLGGGNPLIAKQIIGDYVVWSRMGKPPRAVWAITLRGVPQRPLKGIRGGIATGVANPAGSQNDSAMRYIVDANTGDLLCATSVPHPHSQDN